MRTTITIRADKSLRQELARRAELDGKSLSELIREILETALAERPVGSRTGHLRGRLRLSRRGAGSWRDKIRERNWRS